MCTSVRAVVEWEAGLEGKNSGELEKSFPGIRFIFTGHACGATQMWDLSTALEFFSKGEPTSGEGGPTPQELVRQSSCHMMWHMSFEMLGVIA